MIINKLTTKEIGVNKRIIDEFWNKGYGYMNGIIATITNVAIVNEKYRYWNMSNSVVTLELCHHEESLTDKAAYRNPRKTRPQLNMYPVRRSIHILFFDRLSRIKLVTPSRKHTIAATGIIDSCSAMTIPNCTRLYQLSRINKISIR